MGLLVTSAYTAMIVCANKYVKAQSNLFPPGSNVAELSEYDLKQRVYGSKMVVVVEQTTIAVIWSCKACLLIMYYRITRLALQKENRAIQLLCAYAALGFVVIEILYFAVWCRPIAEYWAVPTSNSQCTLLINHRITKAVFNLSSDVIMLTIALQMLIRSMLPLKKKLILCGIFSLGVFVIIASIMNSYFSFRDPYKQSWIYWYIRETSTAILVANLPYTWQILRELFDLGTFDESSPPPWTFHSARTAQGRRTAQIHGHPSHTTSTTRTHLAPVASNGTRGTQAMTLVDSLSPLQPRGHGRTYTNTPHSSQNENEKELVDAAVHSHDFATIAPPSADLGVFNDINNIDLEQGLAEDASSRSVSPVHSRQPPPRITEDGTGGFYINDRPISPPSRAYLASRSNQSREHSLASTDRRPMSPTPSFTSLESTGTRQQRGGSGAATAGTGRSAHDRRSRARIYE
jgi:hypothetical protein